MEDLFEMAFMRVLAEEGVKINAEGTIIDNGYVNDPDDAGGETKFGISSKYLGRSPRDLTLEQARELYRKDFWLAPGCERVREKSKGLAVMLFDCCVNQGPGIGPKLLQTAVGTYVDGFIGPITMGCITPEKEQVQLAQFALERLRRYAHLVLMKPSQRKFAAGWIIRVLNINSFCKKL